MFDSMSYQQLNTIDFFGRNIGLYYNNLVKFEIILAWHRSSAFLHVPPDFEMYLYDNKLGHGNKYISSCRNSNYQFGIK